MLGGDVVLSVNGIEVLAANASFEPIFESLNKLKPSQRLVTRVLRAGQVVELSTEITP